MWVGTQNNLTFRGVSPRIESQTDGDPFTPASSSNPAFRGTAAGPGGMALTPVGGADLVNPQGTPITPGAGPSNPFNPSNVTPAPPKPQRPPSSPETSLQPPSTQGSASATAAASTDSTADRNALVSAATESESFLSPRLSPQPVNLPIRPGEEKIWTVVGMDLEGLSANELLLHFDPRALNVAEVLIGNAIVFDPRTPPSASIDQNSGLIRVRSVDGKPLQFNGGGSVLALRVRGGLTGETFLVLENPNFHTAGGQAVVANVGGGRAKVD